MIKDILQLNIFTKYDWIINIYNSDNKKLYTDVSEKTKLLLLDLLKQLEDDNNIHVDI